MNTVRKSIAWMLFYAFFQISGLYAQGNAQVDSLILYMEGDNGYSIQWQQSDDLVTWTDLPGGTTNPFTVYPKASESYRAKILRENCAPFYSAAQSVLVEPVQRIEISPGTTTYVVGMSEAIPLQVLGHTAGGNRIILKDKAVSYYANGSFLGADTFSTGSSGTFNLHAGFNGLYSDTVEIDAYLPEEYFTDFLTPEELAIIDNAEPVKGDIRTAVLPDGTNLLEFARENNLDIYPDYKEMSPLKSTAANPAVQNTRYQAGYIPSYGPLFEKKKTIAKAIGMGYLLSDDERQQKEKEGDLMPKQNGLAYVYGSYPNYSLSGSNQKDFTKRRTPFVDASTACSEQKRRDTENKAWKLYGIDCAGLIYHSFKTSFDKLENHTANGFAQLKNWNKHLSGSLYGESQLVMAYIEPDTRKYEWEKDGEPGDIIWFRRNTDNFASHIGFVVTEPAPDECLDGASCNTFIMHSAGSPLQCNLKDKENDSIQNKNMDENHGPVLMRLNQLNYFFKPSKYDWGALRLIPAIESVDIESGDKQNGKPGEFLERNLQVRVSDPHGKSVPGVPVYWYTKKVPKNRGELFGSYPDGSDISGDTLVVFTDHNGLAEVKWKLDSALNQYVIATANNPYPDHEIEGNYYSAGKVQKEFTASTKAWYEGCWHTAENQTFSSEITYTMEGTSITTNKTFQQDLKLEVLADTVVITYQYKAGLARYNVEQRLGYDAGNNNLTGTVYHTLVPGYKGSDPFSSDIRYVPCETQN